MGKTLVIIESSGSKMKKMEKILGNGYIVKASMGHIKTLRGKGEGVVPEEDYKMNYELIRDKSKNSSALKKLATSDTIDNVILRLIAIERVKLLVIIYVNILVLM